MRISDWSSDVCSSDLDVLGADGALARHDVLQAVDHQERETVGQQLHDVVHGERPDVVRHGGFLIHPFSCLLSSAPDPTARRAGRTSAPAVPACRAPQRRRSEEHTSELQSLMRTSYAVLCLTKQNKHTTNTHQHHITCPLLHTTE